MKTSVLALAICFFTLLFFEKSAIAQPFIGASLGFLDSGPAPNVGGNAFVGWKMPLGSQHLKVSAGWANSFLKSKTAGERSTFSGFYGKVAPEITMTADRYNPFKFNAGAAFFGGKYLDGEKLYAPGWATGIAWGFDANATEMEVVGDLFGFFGPNKNGSFGSKMHLMAFLGFALKFE